MRKHAMTAVVFAFAALSLATPARADGIIVPMPVPGRPAPALRSLAIKYHRVTVSIDNQVATTHVDQVFVNELPYDIEGEYIFPLPEEASISEFAMWVDGRRLEAEVLDRDEAREIYEEIVRQRRDPALLEYVGRNAFRARVYPIPAHGEKRVELEYTEILRQDQETVRYVYPLNTEKFSTKPLEDVSVSVRIASRRPLKTIYSPSHDIDVHRESEREAEVGYEAADVTPDKDFVLYYSLGEDDVGINLISYNEPGQDGFFLLLLAPGYEIEEEEIIARDVFFVLDTSGSMRGKKLAQAKRAAKYVLDNLHADDRFNIIAFSTSTRHYARDLRPAGEIEEAHAFINSLKAGGGTNIGRAFEETLAQTRGGRPQVIIFLTDGLATEGERRTEKILGRVDDLAGEDVRIFAFGVGYDVNTMLLDLASGNHQGTSVYVRPDEDIERAVSSFYDKIGTPVLAGISIGFGMVRVDDTFPYPLPDLFAGGQMVMVGRYRNASNTTVTLKGVVNGEPVRYTFDDIRFRKRGGPDFIPRLWATRKIGHLLTQIRLHGTDRELVDDIVELSVRYGIVTPYTSFLIDETEDALTDDGRRRIVGREMQALPAPGLGGAKSGRGGPYPTASPVSGAVAVEKSIAQSSLRHAEVAAQPQTEQVRTIGSKAFVWRDGTWCDTVFDAKQMDPELVAFGSARYFELVRDHPEWGRYLALGPRVILVWEGKAYQIGAAGDAIPEPDSAEATLAVVPTGETASVTPAPTATPTATTTPKPDLWRLVVAWFEGILK